MAARAKTAQLESRKGNGETRKKTNPTFPKKVNIHFPDYTVRNREFFSLKDASFSYNEKGRRSEKHLLDNITFHGPDSKDKLCLMGTNGTGKSTLIKTDYRRVGPS